jgi:hypothetical protein
LLLLLLLLLLLALSFRFGHLLLKILSQQEQQM